MINYGVIGCGVISEVHCPAILEQKDSRLHTVCDINPVKADRLAERYCCNAEYDYEKVLACKDIDVITICLPHHEHFPLFEKAIKAGKHVLTEKPLGISFTEVERMIELSDGSDCKTTVAFQHRHSKVVRYVKNLIENGLFGEITGGEVNFYCCRDMDYYNSDPWRGKWSTEGGGTLINQAIHTIDLANYFLGRIEGFSGFSENRLHSDIEVEDYADGIVFYEGCKTLKLHAENSNVKQWEPKLEIIGVEGGITLMGSDSVIDFSCNKPESEEILNKIRELELSMLEDKREVIKSCYGDLHYRVVDDFTNSIIYNRSPYTSIADGASANKLVLKFYENFISKKKERI